MKTRRTHPKFQSISEAEKHYRKFLIRIGLKTSERETLDIVADALKIDTANELFELARKNWIRR